MDEENIRKIARGHGWPEDAFLAEVNRLVKSYAYSEEGGLAQAQKHYARKFPLKKIGEEKPTLANFTPERLEEPAPPPRPEVKKEKPKPAPKTMAYDKLIELADGGDYLEFFASAGHGKSRLLAHIALETKRAGMKVLFLDSEHSIPRRIQTALGDSYKRLSFMNLDGIIDEISKIKDGYSLVCYDSVGFPVFIKFIQMSMRERGDAIAKTVLIRGYLKDYAERNQVLAIAANQPVSELYGVTHKLEDLEHRPPVGGKSIHVAKGVIRMTIEKQVPEGETVFGLRAFDCQDLPFNKLLAVFTISGEGERLEWKI